MVVEFHTLSKNSLSLNLNCWHLHHIQHSVIFTLLGTHSTKTPTILQKLRYKTMGTHLYAHISFYYTEIDVKSCISFTVSQYLIQSILLFSLSCLFSYLIIPIHKLFFQFFISLLYCHDPVTLHLIFLNISVIYNSCKLGQIVQMLLQTLF